MTAAPKYGDMREDGFYCNGLKKDGAPLWISPQARHRSRVSQIVWHAAKRATCDIDVDYAVSIFPADGLCPALGVPLVWGSGVNDNTPSLDRIDPNKGYVRGNVQWLSHKANRIKNDATLEELRRVYEFMKAA
jgi:hypothetical protein